MNEVRRRHVPAAPLRRTGGKDYQRHAVGMNLVRLQQQGFEFLVLVTECDDLTVRRCRIERLCAGRAFTFRPQDKILRRLFDGRIGDGQSRKRNNRPVCAGPSACGTSLPVIFCPVSKIGIVSLLYSRIGLRYKTSNTTNNYH